MEEEKYWIDHLKQCKGYENISDEQAVEILNDLEAWAYIGMRIYTKKNNKSKRKRVKFISKYHNHEGKAKPVD